MVKVKELRWQAQHLEAVLHGGMDFTAFEAVGRKYPRLLDQLRQLQRRVVEYSGLGEHYIQGRRVEIEAEIRCVVCVPSFVRTCVHACVRAPAVCA